MPLTGGLRSVFSWLMQSLLAIRRVDGHPDRQQSIGEQLKTKSPSCEGLLLSLKKAQAGSALPNHEGVQDLGKMLAGIVFAPAIAKVAEVDWDAAMSLLASPLAQPQAPVFGL